MKKPETLTESFWRYRGVFLVLLMPVLLISAVMVIMPRKSPLQYDRHYITPQTSSQTAGTRYAIVFDAGSTGSRIHVFKFNVDKSDLTLISDTFEQLKPGLSSYADDPQKAAESLKPLLDTAMKTVPKNMQSQTTLSLKATAGLRLLPGDKADKILDAVTAYLKKYPFKMAADAVSIMDGKDEGAFAWLTLNYLLGKLGHGPAATVAAIDLGGGSVQEAFAMTSEEAKSAPSKYLTKLKAGPHEYHVYVHSYLGYGLMAGRAQVISTGNSTSADDGHPCFMKGADITYTYGGKDFLIKALAGPAEFKTCATTSTAAMNVAADCGAAVDQCTFDGVWRGKARTDTSYYVSSYFWDRAIESGIITDERALSWKATPGTFAAKASSACSVPDTSSLLKLHPSVKPDQAPFFCLDLSYCHQLLTAGFKLPPSAPITLVKQVEYNGQNIEASWAVGAAVNDLS